MEQFLQLLRSAEIHISAAQEALEGIQSCADEASGLLDQQAQLIAKTKELNDQLFARKVSLTTQLATVLQGIKNGYELKLSGMTVMMTDGPLKVRLPYVRAREGARQRDTLPTIYDGWEGLTRFMDKRGVFWDFAQVAFAEINACVEAAACNMSRAEAAEKVDKIMGQFHDLKAFVEA